MHTQIWCICIHTKDGFDNDGLDALLPGEDKFIGNLDHLVLDMCAI
jgi:hypothetical protein